MFIKLTAFVRNTYERRSKYMKQGLNTIERKRTIQRKAFGNLRETLQTIGRESNYANPYIWDRLILEVIKNRSKFPTRFKTPKVGIVLDEFSELPASGISFGYLATMENIASIRRYQGNGTRFGSEGWIMSNAYGELSILIQDKRLEKLDLEKHAKLELQVRMSEQLKLPLEARSASA